jgi:hypothetical protein
MAKATFMSQMIQTDHHPTLAPSSLPMLEQCPCFERGEDAAALALEPREETSYKDRGTLLHEVLAAALRDKPTQENEKLLTPNEIEQVKWAYDYVKVHSTTEHPLEVEQRLVLIDNEFNIVTYGTGDAVNGGNVFDLKTGDYHNYWLQMATYGLMQMDRIGLNLATVFVMFSRFRNVHMLTIKREEATRKIMAVIASVLDPEKKPKANPYCRWCKKVMTCPAVVTLLEGITPENYEINDPEALSLALRTARIMAEWSKRIELHAKNLALAGVEIPYFFLKSRQGAREIMDVKRAYELAGLPPDEFIALCNLPVGALEAAIAARENIGITKAKKQVNEKLASVLRRKPPSVRLTPTQNEDEPTEN